MLTLQRSPVRAETGGAQAFLAQPKMSSLTLEHYLRGLSFPAGKREILTGAEVNGAQENILAFFINRLPVRTFRSIGDVSFTVFASSYFFGQD
jgi:hypothetical protein